MSLFRRALAGAASAGVEVANKYIDEKLAASRAQTMAELQRTTAGQIREDDDAFRNDPARVERDRTRKADDFKFGNKLKRDATLEELNDTELQGAKNTAADKEADAEIQRKLKAGEALLPFETKRAAALADVQGKATAKYREPREGANDPLAKLPAPVKASVDLLRTQANQINAAVVKAQADGMWEPDKNKSQADLMVQLRVLNDKAQSLITPYLPQQPGAGDADKKIRDLLTGGGAKPEPGAPEPKKTEPAEPAGPSIFDRVMGAAGKGVDAVSNFVSEGGKVGAGKQAIEQRISEARKGGAPLTDQERQEARRFGIQVPA